MPDICMCSGQGCPQREKCYRFTAKPSLYQSMFTVPPIDGNGNCEEFWDNKGRAANVDAADPESF